MHSPKSRKETVLQSYFQVIQPEGLCLQYFTPFTDRKKEIDQLFQQLDKALDYSGSSVLLKGAIGVGKTRLVDQFIDEIGKRDIRLLRGKVIKIFYILFMGKKNICPQCNYLGTDADVYCPHCGLELISECPECKTEIKFAFARFC